MTEGGGDEQSFDPEAYDDAQAFVSEYGRDLLDVLEPAPGERVLDLGCGTGHVTADIADAVGPTGHVLGIDASRAMVEQARDEHPDLDLRVDDATTFETDDSFDAVFSNAALHWIDDQDAVLARVADALRPGGRFVAEMGASGNVAEIVDAARAVGRERGVAVEAPWHFPRLGEYATRLEAHGFEVHLARTFERETTLAGEAGLREWLDQFGDALLAPFPDAESTVAAIEDRLRSDAFDPDEGDWQVTYRRLQFWAVVRPDGAGSR